MRSSFDPYDADDGYYAVPAPHGTSFEADDMAYGSLPFDGQSRPSGAHQYGNALTGNSAGRFSGNSDNSMNGYGGYPIPEPTGHFSGQPQSAYAIPEPYSVSHARSAYSATTTYTQVDHYSTDMHMPTEGSADENGPSWSGAFTNLIQRMTPVEDQPLEKVEHPMGRLGQDVGRDRQMLEESPPSATWASPWQMSPRQSPAENSLPEKADPPTDASQGWSYGGWGWNSLFGTTEANTAATTNDDYAIGSEAIEAPKMSFNADAFTVDRIGPPAVESQYTVNRNPYDEYDQYRWPARNQDYDEFKGRENFNAYDYWKGAFGQKMANAKAAMPKFPEDLRDLDCRQGCALCTEALLNCTSSYTAVGPAQCPCICASIYSFILLLTIIIGVAVAPMEIETDFDAFMKTDVNSSVLRDTFKAAKNSRSLGRRLQAPLFIQNDIYVAYELTDARPGSVFQQSVMRKIAVFEQKLLALPGWDTLCNRAGDEAFGLEWQHLPRLCTPGISVVNYALPSLMINMSSSVIPQTMTFDGRGRDMVPLDTTLRLVQHLNIQPIVMPIGFTKADAPNTRIARSVFRFKQYCCTSASTQSERDPVVKTAKEDWEKFVKETVLPFLQDEASEIDASEDDFRIFFDGTGFRDIEVKQTLMNDTYLAIGGIVFVLFYLFFHTQSIFLSFVGLISVFLVVPFSYVVFAIFAGTRTMNIASFLSLFLVVGLGSDVVFVYTDYWREAVRCKGTEVEQLTYTLQRGGKASLATTVTTALSFFANLASVLRPLREFGFFMGLCVSFVWVVISLIYVPLCAVDAKYFQRCSCQYRRKRTKETSWQHFFGKLVNCVRGWRRTLSAVAAVWLITSIVCVIVLSETDSGVPNIFPKEHNQNRGKELLEKFSTINEVMDPLFDPPKYAEDVCQEYEFNANDQTNCSLFWCEVQAAIPKSNVDDCKCYRKLRDSCGGGTGAVELRAVGMDSLSVSVAEAHISLSLPGQVSIASTSPQSMAPINLEEWETGQAVLMPMQQVSAQLQTSSYCGWHELCFCNTRICDIPTGWSLVPHALPNNGTSSASRLLNTVVWVVPAANRATVSVVFGIDVKIESPLLGELDKAEMWSFSINFDMSQPWSQRNIYEMCVGMPAHLRVTERDCWIIDFRQYLIALSQPFPVKQTNFYTQVQKFLVNGLTNLRSSSDFLWQRDGLIKACYVEFMIDVNKHENSEKAIGHMTNWNNFMDGWNDEAARSTRGAWHSSELWVRAEAQEELVSSTIITLVIVILLAFAGMLLFTFDFLLSLYVVFATLLVLLGLSFFIVALCQWPIGPIEVIALIVFIGYAVTYSLHIAHKYGSNDALQLPPRLDLDEASATRFQRTQFALKSIGSAALGSAFTTTGCAIFLLFCTLSIFQKLGGVVLVVTLLSIFVAFFELPAMLLIAGPQRPGSYYWLWIKILNLRDAINRMRGIEPRSRPQEELALQSSPTQRMVPEEEKRAPPGTLQLPAKQMHVRVLHTAQVPKPRGMRPSVENMPPLALESNGNAKLIALGNDTNGDVVHKGHVIDMNGFSMPPANGKVHAAMDDVQLRGFDIGEESRREPIQAGSDAKNSSNIVSLNDRWRGVSPPRGGQPEFSNQMPLQSQQGFSAETQRFALGSNARGPSPDPQKPAPKSKPTYQMPRRDRFTNRDNGNTQRGPQGPQSMMAAGGYGLSNNAPWPQPQGQSVGRSTGREPSPLRGVRLPAAS